MLVSGSTNSVAYLRQSKHQLALLTETSLRSITPMNIRKVSGRVVVASVKPGFVQRGTHQAPGRTVKGTHHSVSKLFFRRFRSSTLIRD
jgi:hypothetical protein